MTDDIRVAVDVGGRTIEAGIAHVDRRRRTVTTSFAYNTDYLAAPDAYAVDPALPLEAGRGHVNGLPGAFADCAPDRWGRRLITKRIRAEEGGRPARQISELDYLLGVADVMRQGALRFRRKDDAEFAHPSSEVPKLVRLPELLTAADRVARDDDEPNLSAIKILLDAGTGTLGGARPKASVVGDDGLLHIAKFPHHNDRWDVMAWEKTALDLGIGPQRVDEILGEVSAATVRWREVAAANGVPEREFALFEAVFESFHDKARRSRRD